MTYTTDWNNYPRELTDLVQTAFDMGRPLRVECDSPARAASLKAQIYAFFRALKEAAFKPVKKGESNSALVVYKLAGQVTVRVQGATVILMTKDRTDNMQAVRRALLLSAGQSRECLEAAEAMDGMVESLAQVIAKVAKAPEAKPDKTSRAAGYGAKTSDERSARDE